MMPTSTYATITIEDPNDLGFRCHPTGAADAAGEIYIEFGTDPDAVPIGYIRASRAAAEALARGLTDAIADLDDMIARPERWTAL